MRAAIGNPGPTMVGPATASTAGTARPGYSSGGWWRNGPIALATAAAASAAGAAWATSSSDRCRWCTVCLYLTVNAVGAASVVR